MPFMSKFWIVVILTYIIFFRANPYRQCVLWVVV